MPEPVNVTLDIASYNMPVSEFIDWIRGGLGGEFVKVADDIEEQVKPAIEEPPFGSIVRAPWSGKDHQWVGLWRGWQSDAGVVTDWSQLTDVEVLRVGVGERKDMNTRIRERIVYLRDHTPLVVEQRAYEKAIKAVEELAP